MSFRSDIVDALQGEATISAIVSDRVSDNLHDYEDQMNEKPNAFKFPAISVKVMQESDEDNLTGHDGYNNGLYEITLYDIVTTKKLRSRSATVRATFETDVRAIDTLNSAVKTFLHGKAGGGTIGSFTVRKSHIENFSESSLETAENRVIIIHTLDYTATFNAT